MSILFYKIIATSLGSGYAPVAPGTMGALIGLLALVPFSKNPYFSPIYDVPLFIFLVLILIFLCLGIIASNKLEPIWGHDAQKIVIDETVGYWITVFLFPLTWTNLLIGFILFRLFDIWKPLGIQKMEVFSGGFGVMMDDVLAGIYAGLCLWVITIFFEI